MKLAWGSEEANVIPIGVEEWKVTVYELVLHFRHLDFFYSFLAGLVDTKANSKL